MPSQARHDDTLSHGDHTPGSVRRGCRSGAYCKPSEPGSPAPPATVDLLLPAHLGGHLGIVLLEALGEAGLGGHGLLHAAGDAAVLARRDGLGCEVVDAGHEAVVDQASEELRKGARVVSQVALGARGSRAR